MAFSKQSISFMNIMEKELDRAFLNSFYKEMVNEIGEIFQLFLEEMPSDLKLINENIALGKFSTVADLLHKIAPSFYNVGLPLLTQEAKNIEAIIQAGDLSFVPTRMSAFELTYNEYLPALYEECDRLNKKVI
jgi:HPt (histidine-containing phosphotransfer) domain-containing protein